MPLRIAGPSPDRRLHDQLSLRMRIQEALQRGGRIIPRLNKRARHHRRPASREISKVVFVGIPTNERQRVQNMSDLRSPFHPGEKLTDALAVIPGRPQQSHVERPPINLGVVPLGNLHLTPGLLEGKVQRRLILIQPARRSRGYQHNLQSRVPAPRFISITATINITTTAAAMSPKAIPTFTSEVPRNPYRNAFTM